RASFEGRFAHPPRASAVRYPSALSPSRTAHFGIPMDLNYSAQELAFRDEVRAFVREHLPYEISRKVLEHKRLAKDDYLRWQKILSERGWMAPNWPVEYGGAGWNAVQRHIFDEECAEAGAPRIIPFGVNMVGPVIIAFGSPRQKQHYL